MTELFIYMLLLKRPNKSVALPQGKTQSFLGTYKPLRPLAFEHGVSPEIH